ncbi:MAG: thioredoxin-like domain-containing protein [Verrucomicrobiota bacterium]
MKITSFVLLLCALSHLSLQGEDFRTWQMITGGRFEAKLNEVGSRTVTLENKAGKTIDFPISDLKPSDQAYIREWRATQDAAPSSDAAAFERTDFAKLVYSELVYSKGKRLASFSPEPTDSPKYFAFYRSAMWCPPCRSFTPDLVDFYKKQKRADAPFELIFISSDRSEDDMAEYMDEYEMPWPAFAYGENKSIVARNGTGIPNLIVTDADGNKLLDSYDSSGKFIGPTTVMKELKALLED